MRFSDDFISELRSRIDIEELIGRYTDIKHRGSRTPTALCPFHTEKTPSFVIYRDTSSYYCFGCGAGGDAINFIKNIEHLDYVEAVRFLCERAGMAMPADPVDDEYLRLRRRCYEANREAARFFCSCLKTQAAYEAREYLKKRQLTDETVKRFGLGFAPDTWDALTKYLKGKGFSETELIAFNLARQSKNGHTIDAFRNRLMFPIIDLRGNVTAFGGRVLDNSVPKYLNTSDTVVYKKGQGIYALNFAKNNTERKLILCEGYMDVIAMHQAGFTNAVAALGTAFTTEQISLLSRYCDELFLSFDSDEAGQKATARALRLLSASPMKLRILNITGGKDPDEIIKTQGREAMQGLINEARNDTEYALAKAQKKYDILTDDGKLSFISDAVNILADINNPVQRELYISRVASITETKRDPIAAQVEKTRKGRKKRQEAEAFQNEAREAAGDDKGKIPNPERRANLKACRAEETILASLLKNPDYLIRYSNVLSAECFVTKVNRDLFISISERIKNNRPLELSYFSEESSNEEISILSYLTIFGEKIAGTTGEFEDCIHTLAEEKIKKDASSGEELSDEDFMNIIARKRKKSGV
ncbi:MAG: DNA primase [Oscillospiraceae bacterium]|nr:DNA primase [Oscillospiraceae bacterium]